MYAFVLPLWLIRGKAHFKRQVAQHASLDVAVLPYRLQLLDYLKAQRAQGRRLVLATGGDMQIARQVADHLKLFDMVLASDGKTNLSVQPSGTVWSVSLGKSASTMLAMDGTTL